ncbi:MAG TPA: LPS export ABC transporter periplasmic protein LptC [Candidatus Didemnitutus sp.]|jgi:hypothetical protein
MNRPLALALIIAAAVPMGAQNTTRFSAEAPIKNFKLPMYTVPDGYRTWLIRGTEALVRGANDIDVSELTLTIFSGDAHEKIETMILSPSAHVAPENQTASGNATIRVINDAYEASGTGWHFDHKAGTVSIDRHVKVVLHGELKGFLK